MHDLGALAGDHSEARAVNDSSVVVGWSKVASGAIRAVRWKNGVKRNLGTLGGRNSAALGINEAGVIVGWAETASGDRPAFIWKNGVMTDIGTLGGESSQANAINKEGRVVGWSKTASRETHAFAWSNGRFQDLGDNDTESGEATAINSGRIVGNFGPLFDDDGHLLTNRSAFVFSNGALTLIPTRQESSFALGVNRDGIIVGFDVSEDTDGDPWVRLSDGTLEYLPELSNGGSTARAINRFGTIVGFSRNLDGRTKAVIWRRK